MAYYSNDNHNLSFGLDGLRETTEYLSPHSLGCEDEVYNWTSCHTDTPLCLTLSQYGPINPSGPRPSIYLEPSYKSL